ncbi:hypothetical protein J5Y03_10255 [Bacillus sp. RG28]|uniref:Uncharacterized protein n=1 Tax=Gottfriedia endophytica TaxID=2820819 RepID=A0A940SJ14_9BACI|nr:hypothetical protein [Gottfriedia endophytica]MBP0725570.1 hypothetical protein [Gottfriedia endophytica]
MGYEEYKQLLIDMVGKENINDDTNVLLVIQRLSTFENEIKENPFIS